MFERNYSSRSSCSSATVMKQPEDITHRGVGLREACVAGDLPLAAMLLAEGAEVGIDMLAADADGNTPLHYACLGNNADLILFLLRKAAIASGLSGIEYDHKIKQKNHRLAKAKPLILDARNESSETPLLRAAVGGDVGVVRALLEAGANVFAVDASRNTVFHNAARNGRLWVTAYLLRLKTSRYQRQHSAAARGGGADERGRAQGPARGGRSADGAGSSEGTIFGGSGDGNDGGNDNGDPTTDETAGNTNGDHGGVVCRETTGKDQGGGKGALMLADPAVDSLLRQTDCDGHTALDWACYSGHSDVARLLIEHGLSPFSTDAGGKICLHWAASQGRTNVCRYLVLLGVDPFQPDGGGSDAFSLAEGQPSVAREALSLARVVIRRGALRRDALRLGGSRGAGATLMLTVQHDRDQNGGGGGGGGNIEGLSRAPTAGSAVHGETGPGGVEKGGRCALLLDDNGKVGERKGTTVAGSVVVLPERLNPTRSWVVLSYAVPICGLWGLAFVIPWWGWFLALVAVVSAGKRAAEVAALFSEAEMEARTYGRGGGRSSGRLGGSRGRDYPSKSTQTLPPVPSMLVAPEKHVGMWAGFALCFISETVIVVTRLLTSTRYEGGDTASDSIGNWSFAGASITGGDTADGNGEGAGTMTITAWAACVSIGFLAAMLALWSTLLAGDGRGVAVEQAAKSAAAAAAAEAAEVAAGARAATEDDGSSTTASTETSATGKHGEVVGSQRGGMMGWGDPGVVVMCPREDMKELVEGVVANAGPVEARKLCQTCLVRKPLRSKHCADCGLCVGRMDHHCVWLNNCVGCGNHRRFVVFVFCQVAYAALFFSVATASFVKECPLRYGFVDVLGILLGKEYLPALLLTVAAGLGIIMLCGILYEQIRNMLANLTCNEKINRRRYPWLNASPSGPSFNRYDLGAWDNLMEFWGIGGSMGAGGSGGRGGSSGSGWSGDRDNTVGARGVDVGSTMRSCRRRPHDYLRGYELPVLNSHQEARLQRVLQAHEARLRKPTRGKGCHGRGSASSRKGRRGSSISSSISSSGSSAVGPAPKKTCGGRGGGGGSPPPARCDETISGGERRRPVSVSFDNTDGNAEVGKGEEKEADLGGKGAESAIGKEAEGVELFHLEAVIGGRGGGNTAPGAAAPGDNAPVSVGGATPAGDESSAEYDMV